MCTVFIAALFNNSPKFKTAETFVYGSLTGHTGMYSYDGMSLVNEKEQPLDTYNTGVKIKGIGHALWVAHAYNPSTEESGIFEFKTGLGYVAEILFQKQASKQTNNPKTKQKTMLRERTWTPEV
jgi:hypothetical protein